MDASKSKLGYVAIGIWGIFAIIGDLLGLIPFAGDFVGPIFWIAFATFLWMKGFGFLNPKRLAVEGVDMVIKMIPALQELPVELLIGAIAVIVMIKFEEKTGVKIPGKEGGNNVATGAHSPVNAGGVRKPSTQTVTSSSGGNNHIATAPLNANAARQPSQAPKEEKKLDPKRQAEADWLKNNPDGNYGMHLHNETLKNKKQEYLERGFDVKEAEKSAREDAAHTLNRHRNRIWSDSQQDYL